MYKLTDIFNQANTDEVSINIDGVGYEARLRQGIKITKEDNTFHIFNTTIGVFYQEISEEQYQTFYEYGWVIGVHKLALINYKRKLKVVENKNSKAILVGDKKQLQSISAGRCHDMLWNKTHVKKVEMNEVLRQLEGSESFKIVQTFKSEYTKNNSENALKKSLAKAEKLGRVLEIKQAKERLNITVSKAINNIRKSEKSIIICSKNKSKNKINNAMRNSLKNTGYVDKKDTKFSIMTNVNNTPGKSSFTDNYKANSVFC